MNKKEWFSAMYEMLVQKIGILSSEANNMLFVAGTDLERLRVELNEKLQRVKPRPSPPGPPTSPSEELRAAYVQLGALLALSMRIDELAEQAKRQIKQVELV